MDVLNMKTRNLLIISAALLLAACTRSATTEPVITPTEDPLESIFSTVATQTALAASSHEGPDLGASETPTITALFGSTATLASSPTMTPTVTTTPAPTQELSVPSTYTLHLGEWPYCLARRFDIDPDALLAANGLNSGNANNLSVGTKLTIPSGAGSFGGQRALKSHPAEYVATGSDTFYSIACAFGDVWPEHIAEANGMDIDENIPGGMQLHIP
jgi:LysM repeat protein